MKVLITGAGRGIGNAIAAQLCQSGHDLLLTSNNKVSVKSAVSALSGISHNICGVAADFRTHDGAKRVREYATGVGFSPDILILVAGCFFDESLLAYTPAHLSEQFHVNLISQIEMVRLFVDDLKKSRSAKVVVIGSTAGFEAYAYGGVYSITKWALRGFVENLRSELRPSNIGVSILHPGPTWTDLWKGEELPRERLLEATDIAKLVDVMLTLSPQANVDELVVRPLQGDIHD